MIMMHAPLLDRVRRPNRCSARTWPGRRCVLLAVALGFCLPVAAATAQPGSVDRDLDYLPDVEVGDGRDLLDVFMPVGTRPAPVVVFFHGGGLLEGDKAHGEILAARLLPAGIGVVSANYRLSPGVMHPVHLQDAAAAFAWTVENIADYGGDPERIFVSGHSAGAYLAAMLAVDPSLLAAHGLAPGRLAGSLPISPFLYVEETAKERPKTVWGEDPAVWLEASVTPYIGPGKGPILLIYADGDADWRKAQNERFAQALHATGSTAVRAVEVPGRDHTTVLTDMNETDDPVGALLLEFIAAW